MTETETVIEAIIEFMTAFKVPEEILRPLFNKGEPLYESMFVQQSPIHHPEGNVGMHTLMVLYNLRERNKITLWSALLHDVGKVNTTKKIEGKIVAYGHEKESVKIASRIMLNNEYFNDIYDEVIFCIDQHMRIKHMAEMKKSKREKLLNHPYFIYLGELAYADSMGGKGDLSWMEGIER